MKTLLALFEEISRSVNCSKPLLLANGQEVYHYVLEPEQLVLYYKSGDVQLEINTKHLSEATFSPAKNVWLVEFSELRLLEVQNYA